MDENKYKHRIYILHAWQSEYPGEYRYVLEDPLTAQRRGFIGLEALTAFLAAEALLPNRTAVGNEHDPPAI
jgi:hypothetical protein